MTSPTIYARLDSLIYDAVRLKPIAPNDLLRGEIQTECSRLTGVLKVPDVNRILSRRIISLRRAGRIRSRGRYLWLC